MNKERVIEFLNENATITLSHAPEDEDTAPEDHLENHDDVEAVRNQLDRLNSWAWCYVIVKAQFKTWDGAAYLGACSYGSEEDFRKDDYFTDMKDEAITNLAARLLQDDSELTALKTRLSVKEMFQ